LQGLLGDRARNWRAKIIEASALIEAGIDFADEGDVPSELIAPALAKIKTLLGEIQQVLAGQGRGERLRDGMVIAIAGPPNVGKSTLMNQLARREVAIVSPHAGTTRDIIEVQLDLDGYPVTVIDTAGVRETDDPVEQEGVRRARARAAEADLVLWLSDAEHDTNLPREGTAPIWLVRNKIDLDVTSPSATTPSRGAIGQGQGQEKAEPMLAISASRGDGIGELISALVGFAQEFFGATESGMISRIRQRELLQQTAASLEHSVAVIGEGEELAAEELRAAAYSLGRLLGRVDVEDILDVIFREFCIGK
jgi:tRNA modification GTPase